LNKKLLLGLAVLASGIVLYKYLSKANSRSMSGSNENSDWFKSDDVGVPKYGIPINIIKSN
jgi:hypothetical protein